MTDIVKGFGISAQGEKSIFNFPGDEELGNPLKSIGN
jgi:hypothetical protein